MSPFTNGYSQPLRGLAQVLRPTVPQLQAFSPPATPRSSVALVYQETLVEQSANRLRQLNYVDATAGALSR
jgi:hypothetical protein